VGLGHWKLLHELNSRREVGIIVRHSKVLSGLVDTSSTGGRAFPGLPLVCNLEQRVPAHLAIVRVRLHAG
jgi:hypothetical protein